jgi:glycosyltransferase involved in cell wall biosynthesis
MQGTRRLVHITTVPMTLHFLRGQPGYMAENLGLATHAISSPGVDFGVFLEREPGVVAHEVRMARRITPLKDAQALIALVVLLRRLQPAIVHTHTPKAGLLGVLAARLAGVPAVIHHIHGGVWMAATGARRTIARWTDRVTCAAAHRVLCVSESVRARLIEERLCADDKINVLGHGSINGVDADEEFNPVRLVGQRSAVRGELGIPEAAVVIGFVGRFTREKGIAELIAAWRNLVATMDDLHLMLVGEQDSATPLPDMMIRELHADPRVHMTGLVWDTARLYAAMDIFVLPTYREGFPVVLLEAAAMQLPIIATDVPGCIDAVAHDCTGVLVPPGDVEALETALRVLASDPFRRVALGSAGRRRVLRDFQPRQLWQALACEYADSSMRADSRLDTAAQVF